MGLFGSNDITGIDIGAGSIKVVRIAGGRRPRILSAGLLEMPLEPGKADGVSAGLSVLRSGKKLGKKTVTLLPGRHLTIRHLTFPRMPLSELREAVRWESKRHISYPLDEAMIEFLIVGEKHEGTVDKYNVLLVAAERSAVVEHLAPFDQAGIKVEAVDANPVALRNVFRQEKPTDANTLVVDMGAGKTEINIFKLGQLRFSRCLETGGLDITRAVAEDLGVGTEEAEAVKLKTSALSMADADRAAGVIRTKLDGILLEIRRSVEYYKTTFREKGVEHTVLTGGVALTPGIREYFSQSLEGPVKVDNPFSMLTAGKDITGEFGAISPRFSAAVGLALRKA